MFLIAHPTQVTRAVARTVQVPSRRLSMTANFIFISIHLRIGRRRRRQGRARASASISAWATILFLFPSFAALGVG